MQTELGNTKSLVSEELAIIYTTVSKRRDAEKLAEEAVQSQYVACVNILPEITSIYPWEGVIGQSSECGMIFKTTIALAEKLEEWIIANHPYEVPAILKFRANTSEQFLVYVQSCTQSKG